MASSWYDRNSVDFNKRRRDRYKNEPDYKAKRLAENETYRETHQVEKEKSHVCNIEIDGVIFSANLYTIGTLAEMLKCSAQAIRNWEKEGVIFKTPLRDDLGVRLYTQEMISDLFTVLKHQGKLTSIVSRAVRRDTALYLCLNEGTHLLEEVLFFKRSKLLEACGRTDHTVRELEASGIIPTTPYHDAFNGNKLYTVRMLNIVKDVFSKLKNHVITEAEHEALAHIKSRWTRCPNYVLIINNSHEEPLDGSEIAGNSNT